MTRTTSRVCALLECENGLDGLKANARYCSASCRSEASRQRQGLSSREIAAGAMRFWRGYRTVRSARKRSQQPSSRVVA